MDEIIQKLQHLPPPLSDVDYEEISQLIRAFDIKTSEQFKQVIQSEELKISGAVVDYIIKWLDLAQCILHWETTVTRSWFKKKPDQLLGNDELLPLTILLLPDDLDLLTQMELILEDAKKVDTGELSTYLMVNLHSAIVIKLLEAKSNIKIKNEEDIIAVAEEVRLAELIERLKILCQDYLDFIGERFLGKSTPKIAQTPCLEELYHEEILTILLINPPIAKNDRLTLILEKYKIMGDMYLTLIRNKTESKHKLIEFIAKFLHHLNNLKPVNGIYLPLPTFGNHRFDFKIFPNPIPSTETKIIEKLIQLVYKINSKIEFANSDDTLKMTHKI